MTNCLFFMLGLYWRRARKGKRSSMSVRISDAGPFFHFMYGEWRNGKQRVISYKPKHSIDRTCPPALFVGEVKWGDEPRRKKT